jgi:hypothetical protein
VSRVIGDFGAVALVSASALAATMGHPFLIARFTSLAQISALPWCSVRTASRQPNYFLRLFLPTDVFFFGDARDQQHATAAVITTALAATAIVLCVMAGARRKKQLEAHVEAVTNYALERAVASGLPVVRRLIREEAAAAPPPPASAAVAMVKHVAMWLTAFGVPLGAAFSLTTAVEGGRIGTPVGFAAGAGALLCGLVPFAASRSKSALLIASFLGYTEAAKRKSLAPIAGETAVQRQYRTKLLRSSLQPQFGASLFFAVELLGSLLVGVAACFLPQSPDRCAALSYAATAVTVLVAAYAVAVRPFQSAIFNGVNVLSVLLLPVTAGMASAVSSKVADAVSRSDARLAAPPATGDPTAITVDVFLLAVPMIIAHLTLVLAGLCTALVRYSQRQTAKRIADIHATRAPLSRMTRLLREPARRTALANGTRADDPLLSPQPANPLSDFVARMRMAAPASKLLDERQTAYEELMLHPAAMDHDARDELEEYEEEGTMPPAPLLTQVLADNVSRPLWGSQFDANHAAHPDYLPLHSTAWLAMQHNVDMAHVDVDDDDY